MKRFFLSMIVFIIVAFIAPKEAFAFVEKEAGQSAQLRIETSQVDSRVEKLEQFLTLVDSPLVLYADEFIYWADFYGLDEYGLTYLVPSITGLESSFAKRYPKGSYNAYGWAGGNYYFDSWEDSIEHVTRVLRQKYIDRGATTIQRIGPIYAESPTWAQRVGIIYKKIADFQTPAKPQFLKISF